MTAASEDLRQARHGTYAVEKASKSCYMEQLARRATSSTTTSSPRPARVEASGDGVTSRCPTNERKIGRVRQEMWRVTNGHPVVGRPS